MAINEIWIGSPHYSTSRGPYNKVVFHTTQGAMRIRDLGAWFQNPAAQCSSHHGADSYERGLFGAYVYENYAAWTQGDANGYCLSIELCGYAEWTRSQWLNERAILVDNAAEWLRYMVDKYDIPWTVLSDSEAQNANKRGICQHVNLGQWGSGHWDCGDGFPLDVIIQKAQGGITQPEPPKPEEDEDMAYCVIPSLFQSDVPISMSLSGPHKAMGLCVDVGILEDPHTQVRAAFHSSDNSGWEVIKVYCDPSHTKVVVWPKKPFDGVSLTRVDNQAVNIIADFGK